jgi:hypothetical protein
MEDDKTLRVWFTCWVGLWVMLATILVGIVTLGQCIPNWHEQYLEWVGIR